jgi:hypothetical protein
LARKSFHQQQASHNEELANELINQVPLKFKDWAVIAAFYAAVHYVEAFMAKAKKHPKSHTARLAWVNSRGDLSDDAKDAYKELLRYLTNGASARGAWLRDQDVAEMVTTGLALLRSEVLTQLAS